MNITSFVRRSLLVLGTAGLGLLVLAVGGCSSFNRDFKAMRAQPAPADTIVGAWEGKWVSDSNGHTGGLRCILTPLPNEDGTLAAAGKVRYRARFHATYAKILGYSYAMDLVADKRDDAMHFQGEADLGWLAGGVYKCEGQATPATWQSTYTSKHDQGRFEMTRVAGEQ